MEDKDAPHVFSRTCSLNYLSTSAQKRLILVESGFPFNFRKSIIISLSSLSRNLEILSSIPAVFIWSWSISCKMPKHISWNSLVKICCFLYLSMICRFIAHVLLHTLVIGHLSAEQGAQFLVICQKLHMEFSTFPSHFPNSYHGNRCRRLLRMRDADRLSRTSFCTFLMAKNHPVPKVYKTRVFR